MANRDSSNIRLNRPVAFWLGLGRGWQAVLLGVGIVLACHLAA